MPHFKSPFVKFVDTPSRNMRGQGAPKSTVFGVLGMTKESPYMKSLGGLVRRAPTKAIPKGTIEKEAGMMSERGAVGMVPRTHIPGQHHGMVPYAGEYMSHLGKEL